MTQILTVPLIGQRDSRWANQLLGHSNKTIGSHGCAVACLTMLGCFAAHQEPEPLSNINNKLKGAGGFYNRNLLRWGTAHMIFSCLKYVGRIDIGSRPAAAHELHAVTSRISRGIPVIVYVDASAREPGLQQHFVLATGYDPDREELTIHDPWYADVAGICPRYGKTVQEAVWGIIMYDVVDESRPRQISELKPIRTG